MVLFWTLTKNSWIYLAEILPSQWMGYAVASNYVSSIIVSVVCPYAFTYINRWTYFCFFIFTLCALVYVWIKVSETMGKSFEQIRDDFMSNEARELEKAIPMKELKAVSNDSPQSNFVVVNHF